jgi:2-polyprenyl-6-hydroxyphenyl methylase/3-demethylubiquinone-9 3-methyltransferase
MIDNDFYNKEAEQWWSEKDSPLMMIRYTMNPLRFAYVMKHFVIHSYDYRGKKVLDVGCGGGFLTEEIAKFGLDTTGLDPSAPTLDSARRHAEMMDLRIEYLEGSGERLPFGDAEFDIVFCCDVLEHVEDFRAVLKDVSRVLKPGGLFFFETINRTLLSFVVVIFLLQRWSVTSIIPPNIHDWKRFIKPGVLSAVLAEYQIKTHDIRGILPGFNFVYNIFLLRRKVKNKINFQELCKLFSCHESDYKGLCYIGCGVKRVPCYKEK